jgi:cation:H+ antiporter
VWLDAGWLLLGILLAAAGGELFVRAAVGLAAHLRVSHALIGSTVAAFATSAPELSVAVNAGLAGTPRIALGDALGSNVVNIGLILGLALVLRANQVDRGGLTRDLGAISLATALILLLSLDGQLGRIDACALLALFAAWLVFTVRAGRITGEPSAQLRAGRLHRTVATGVIGMILLILAGTYVVHGASGLGNHFGVDPFLLGAVLVAFGTSTPELATTVVATLRGHDEIALGNILGSNIFNASLIVPVAALINPIRINLGEVGLALGFGLALVVALLPPPGGRLGRNRGLLMLVLYGTYLWTLTALGLVH